MQAQFEAAMQSTIALEADAAATQRRMDSANALLSALSGEEARWTQQSSAFDATIQRLTGKQIACDLMSTRMQGTNQFQLLLLLFRSPKTHNMPLSLLQLL